MKALLLAACLLLLSASTTLAHASLVEADPEEGAVLDGTPQTLRLTFDEPLGTDRSRVVVRDARGGEVVRGAISPDDPRVITVELPALAPGPYEALWTAVTPEDGGVTRGTISFLVEQPSPAPTPTAPPTSRPTGGPSVAPAPTFTPPPTAAPDATPSASAAPSATPAGSEPGNAELLVALLVAGVLVGGLALYFFRR